MINRIVPLTRDRLGANHPFPAVRTPNGSRGDTFWDKGLIEAIVVAKTKLWNCTICSMCMYIDIYFSAHVLRPINWQLIAINWDWQQSINAISEVPTINHFANYLQLILGAISFWRGLYTHIDQYRFCHSLVVNTRLSLLSNRCLQNLWEYMFQGNWG